MKGRLIIVSAPAGTGKTTLVDMLEEEFPDQVTRSVSCTTRKARVNEVSGVHYFFLDKESFEEKIQNEEFLEHAIVFGDYYGTLKETVCEQQATGKAVILVIDTQGALELKKRVKALLIFIAPPSLEVLEKRLMRRQTESVEALQKRLRWATEEMKQIPYYDYVVINDDLQTAYRELQAIILGNNYF